MNKLQSLRLAVRRWRQFLANRGLRATGATLRQAAWRCLHPSEAASIEIAAELWRNADQGPPTVHPFDLANRTETSGLIWGEDLVSGHRHDVWNTAYYGIAPSVFEQALVSLRASAGLDWSQFTFIDLGAGKGRAVLLASCQPFARIVGVELSPHLHALALTNVERFPRERMRSPHVEIVQADAADFPWTIAPSGPLLFFLYNPFSRPVLEKFLKKLEGFLQARPGGLRQQPHEVYILYINPELDAVLLRQPCIEKLWQQTLTIGSIDQSADRFGSTTETVAAYRYTRHQRDGD